MTRDRPSARSDKAPVAPRFRNPVRPEPTDDPGPSLHNCAPANVRAG